MERKKQLKTLLNDLLEKIKEVEDFLFNEFDEDERESEELKDYLESLNNIENTINFYN
jgi:hypothetical protein